MQQSSRVFREQSRVDFRSVGAIAPSSRWLAAAMTSGLATDRGETPEPRQLLEVGAGTGALTTAIAAAMGPRDALLVVEQNAAFTAHLEGRIATDPAFRSTRDRIRILHASVDVLEPVPGFDAIVSSLPFNNFAAEEVAAYLDLLHRLLVPGGELRFFEYLAIRRLRGLWATRRERRRLAGVNRVLTGFLTARRSNCRIVWRNVPPAVVHTFVRELV